MRSRFRLQYVCVVEMVYISDLRSDAERIEGSNPSADTIAVEVEQTKKSISEKVAQPLIAYSQRR